MNEKTAHIVAQYIRRVFAEAHVRPYENRLALSNGVTGSLTFEPLPEEGHWRVLLDMAMQGINSENVLCFEAGCSLEGIALLQGIEPDEVETVLTHTIAGLMVGHVRTAITNASMATGYGPVMLPPMAGAQLESLVQKTREQ